jgi:hypothetical protein
MSFYESCDGLSRHSTFSCNFSLPYRWNPTSQHCKQPFDVIWRRAVLNFAAFVRAEEMPFLPAIRLFPDIMNRNDGDPPTLSRPLIRSIAVPKFRFRMQMILRKRLLISFQPVTRPAMWWSSKQRGSASVQVRQALSALLERGVRYALCLHRQFLQMIVGQPLWSAEFRRS